MEEEIQAALLGIVSDERIDMIVRILQQLRQLGYDNHIFELQQVVNGQEDIDGDGTDTLIGRVEDILTVAIWNVLGQLGIEVTDSPLKEYIPLLDTVASWDHCIFPEELHDAINGSDSSVEAFSEIVNTIVGCDVEHLMSTVTSVNPGVIRIISCHIQKQIRYDDTDNDEDDEAVDAKTHMQSVKRAIRKTNKILNLAPKPEGFAYEVTKLSHHGYQPCTSFKVLLNAAMYNLDGEPMKMVAWELAALYTYSDSKEPFEKEITQFTDSREDKFTIINTLGRVFEDL